MVLLFANVSLLIGAAIPMAGMRRRPKGRSPGSDPSAVALRRLTLLLFVAGMALFVAYLREIGARYTLAALIVNPWVVRSGISRAEVGWSLKYFYFTMPAAALAMFHLLHFRTHRMSMRLMILACVLCNAATTGRTAVIWLTCWLVFVYAYSSNGRRTFRQTLWIFCSATGCLCFFLVAGTWMGKTTANSGLRSKSALTGISEAALIPYTYLTASIPALDNLISTATDLEQGRNTFVPLVKVAAALEGRPIPTEVAPFTSTPYLTNTYTYLQPYVLDFGILGALTCPFFCGLAVGGAYRAMQWRIGLASVYLNALLATFLILSFGTNRLVSTPTWCHLGLGLLLPWLCQKRVRTTSDFARLDWAPLPNPRREAPSGA